MAHAFAREREGVLNRTDSVLLKCSKTQYGVAAVCAGSVLDCPENSNRLVAGAGRVAGN
jgi:hypothetical protein